MSQSVETSRRWETTTSQVRDRVELHVSTGLIRGHKEDEKGGKNVHYVNVPINEVLRLKPNGRQGGVEVGYVGSI